MEISFVDKFVLQGQIIAANSYQITLLTGSVGQAADKLYTIASIYLAGSLIWWFLYRRLKTVYVLSLPFAFYGSAFLLIGLAPLGSSVASRGWIQNVATGFYALASSSGSIYFAVNFGDEGMLLSVGLKTKDSLLMHLRWCSCHILGLPCLYHPRHATNLRCGSVVLGLRTDQSLRAYFYWKQCCCCKPPRDHDSWCGNCLPDVGSGNCALDRPAKILSTSTRAYTFFLLLAFQEEDYSGILRPYGMTKLDSWLMQFYSGSSS